MHNILVLCVGNICRSPLAHALVARKLPGTHVQSAGLGALVGRPADPLSVQVAVKEFAPDVIILPGPGDTLGGAIAQSLIGIGWQGIAGKADFTARQAENPVLLSMGRPEQRERVVKG